MKGLCVMIFYKAIAEKKDWFNNYLAYKGELFTEKERNSKVRYIMDFYFQPIEISKKNTQFVCGRRFEK